MSDFHFASRIEGQRGQSSGGLPRTAEEEEEEEEEKEAQTEREQEEREFPDLSPSEQLWERLQTDEDAIPLRMRASQQEGLSLSERGRGTFGFEELGGEGGHTGTDREREGKGFGAEEDPSFWAVAEALKREREARHALEEETRLLREERDDLRKRAASRGAPMPAPNQTQQQQPGSALGGLQSHDAPPCTTGDSFVHQTDLSRPSGEEASWEPREVQSRGHGGACVKLQETEEEQKKGRHGSLKNTQILNEATSGNVEGRGKEGADAVSNIIPPTVQVQVPPLLLPKDKGQKNERNVLDLPKQDKRSCAHFLRLREALVDCVCGLVRALAASAAVETERQGASEENRRKSAEGLAEMRRLLPTLESCRSCWSARTQNTQQTRSGRKGFEFSPSALGDHSDDVNVPLKKMVSLLQSNLLDLNGPGEGRTPEGAHLKPSPNVEGNVPAETCGKVEDKQTKKNTGAIGGGEILSRRDHPPDPPQPQSAASRIRRNASKACSEAEGAGFGGGHFVSACPDSGRASRRRLQLCSLEQVKRPEEQTPSSLHPHPKKEGQEEMNSTREGREDENENRKASGKEKKRTFSPVLPVPLCSSDSGRETVQRFNQLAAAFGAEVEKFALGDRDSSQLENELKDLRHTDRLSLKQTVGKEKREEKTKGEKGGYEFVSRSNIKGDEAVSHSPSHLPLSDERVTNVLPAPGSLLWVEPRKVSGKFGDLSGSYRLAVRAGGQTFISVPTRPTAAQSTDGGATTDAQLRLEFPEPIVLPSSALSSLTPSELTLSVLLQGPPLCAASLPHLKSRVFYCEVEAISGLQGVVADSRNPSPRYFVEGFMTFAEDDRRLWEIQNRHTAPAPSAAAKPRADLWSLYSRTASRSNSSAFWQRGQGRLIGDPVPGPDGRLSKKKSVLILRVLLEDGVEDSGTRNGSTTSLVGWTAVRCTSLSWEQATTLTLLPEFSKEQVRTENERHTGGVGQIRIRAEWRTAGDAYLPGKDLVVASGSVSLGDLLCQTIANGRGADVQCTLLKSGLAPATSGEEATDPALVAHLRLALGKD
eukprot:Cvel_23829.t1-p1 / transcript=Cvel_23829.t1 / gene=Cvel_23829 / organism=Chromera_velia_CCMP2878 / gene_product=hypothetical protein / transcript_product=hypothetical protein / location=Cvel_scaffold2505:5038-12270(-) / protein_length=1048 / sequence_SO=supercontig / SO=protein_coding / is_pseudo=false